MGCRAGDFWLVCRYYVNRNTAACKFNLVFAARTWDLVRTLIARLLCLLGWHDFKIIEGSFGFGASGGVEKVECRRCGLVTTRSGDTT